MTADAVSNVSQAPSGTSNDEGGFNEPSPEIKAKLKPAYPFDVPPVAIDATIEAPKLFSDKTSDDEVDEAEQVLDEQKQPHTLHYVDFGYRLNPDGSESKHCYGDEIEMYADANGNQNSVHDAKPPTNGFAPIKQSVVYATIKSDVPPPPPPIDFDTDSIGSGDMVTAKAAIAKDDIDDEDEEEDDDIDAKFEQIYHSPQNGNTERSNGNENSDQLFETLAQMPDVATATGPLDIDDVEYADVSDKEELPAAMTSYEADRLLSSRYVIIYTIIHVRYTQN